MLLMSDTPKETQVTKHNSECQMAFGRKDPKCPRCIELLNGASPRKGWPNNRKQMDAERSQAIRQHNFAECAKRNVVCTHFEW